MQGLLALVPLVLQVLPKLAGLFGTPLAGSLLDKAGQVAKDVFGTIDAAQIQFQIEQDKNKLEEFRIRMEAATKDEQAYFADVQSARTQTTSLAQVNSPIAYGAPIMSAVVTIGFIVILTLFVTYALSLDAYQQSVVTILIGYLGAAFQQAVNYWLGTTRQSREKDTVLASRECRRRYAVRHPVKTERCSSEVWVTGSEHC
jgi:hypothetical protein